MGYLGPWHLFTLFVDAHPCFIDTIHVLGPVLPLLGITIWNQSTDQIKQVASVTESSESMNFLTRLSKDVLSAWETIFGCKNCGWFGCKPKIYLMDSSDMLG